MDVHQYFKINVAVLHYYSGWSRQIKSCFAELQYQKNKQVAKLHHELDKL